MQRMPVASAATHARAQQREPLQPRSAEGVHALKGGRPAEAGLPFGRPMGGVNLWCRRLEVQSSELKLYVPSQCHTPSASTVTLALPWNIANAPVPPSNVMVP